MINRRLSDVSMGSREHARDHPYYPIMQMCPPPGMLAVNHSFCLETRAPRTLIYSKTRYDHHSTAPYYPGLRSLSYTDHGNENCDLCGIGEAVANRNDGTLTERCAYHSTNLGGVLEQPQYTSFDMGAPQMTVDPQRQAGRKVSLRNRNNFPNGAHQRPYAPATTYHDTEEPFVCLRPAPPPPSHPRNGMNQTDSGRRLHSEPQLNQSSRLNGNGNGHYRMNSEPRINGSGRKTGEPRINGSGRKNGEPRHVAANHVNDTRAIYKQEHKADSEAERAKALTFIRKSYDLKSAGANYSTVVRRQDNLRPYRTPLPTFGKPPMPQVILTNETYADTGKSVMLTPETETATLALDTAPSMMSSIVSKTRLGLHDPSQDAMTEHNGPLYDFTKVAPASMARKTKASMGSLQRRLDQLLDEVHGEMGALDEDIDPILER